MNTNVIIEELDRLYKFDIDKYLKECDSLKKMGVRIFRNSDGKHKVIAPASKTKYSNDFYGAFGDIFGNIFGGKG